MVDTFPILSRNDAIAQGKTTYFTGKPCAYGHIDLRFVSSYACRECARLKSKRDYDADTERHRERVRLYNQREPDKRAAAVTKWRRKNPTKVYLHKVNSYAKRRGASGKMTADEWLSLLNQYGHVCLCCGAGDVPLTVDHIIPISMGGSNTIDNVQPLCLSCNRAKQTESTDYRKANRT